MSLIDLAVKTSDVGVDLGHVAPKLRQFWSGQP